MTLSFEFQASLKRDWVELFDTPASCGILFGSNRSVLPMLSYFQNRSIKQTTVFRGPLEIGSQLKINVYGYIRVRNLT